MADHEAVFIDVPAHTRIVTLTNAVDSLTNSVRKMVACLPPGQNREDAVALLDDASASLGEIVGAYWRNCGDELEGGREQ